MAEKREEEGRRGGIVECAPARGDISHNRAHSHNVSGKPPE